MVRSIGRRLIVLGFGFLGADKAPFFKQGSTCVGIRLTILVGVMLVSVGLGIPGDMGRGTIVSTGLGTLIAMGFGVLVSRVGGRGVMYRLAQSMSH